MPRKEWKAVDPVDGWIKIIRGRRPPSEQWPRLQKQVVGSGGDFKSVKGRWRSGAPTAQLPNKVCTLETAMAALGPEDVSVKAELEAALVRAKIQFQGTTRVSPSPDVVVAEAKKKVFRLEKALEVFGDSTGQEVDFLKKALTKAHEVARERPLEVQIKECREFISRSEQRLARLEADRQAELALLTEGKSRLSRLESQHLEAPRQQPKPGVTELEQRIQALVHECEALRAAATPVLHQEKPIWCSERCPSLDNIPPVPDDVQDVEGWLSCRNCELRNALEFGDPGTIAFLGKLVAEGASKLAVLTEDVPMSGLALNNHVEVDAKRRCLEGKSTLPSMVGNQVP